MNQSGSKLAFAAVPTRHAPGFCLPTLLKEKKLWLQRPATIRIV
jgi:hypothetical protein